MNQPKKVTVLMPVYNGEKYLKEAIDSILNQTFTDFDCLIINDGSTDSTDSIISGYSDPRIKYIKNEENIGLIKTLNIGFAMIESEYIVRMDADDISFPKRLEKQVNYMINHPDIAVLGTAAIHFRNDSILKKTKTITRPDRIRSRLLFSCSLIHPSVIIRNTIIKENQYSYNEEFNSVEDFGLWQKISFNHDISNTKDTLIYYRINEDGVSCQAEKNIAKRDESHKRVYAQAFDYFGIAYSDRVLQQYREFLTGRSFKRIEDFSSISELIKQILIQAMSKNYDIKTIRANLRFYFKKNCLANNISLNKSKVIHREYFDGVFSFSIFEQMKYIFSKFKNGLLK